MLSLGKKISENLDQHDFLSNWMAQYLAERLVRLDSIDQSDLEVARSEIADLVLRIWDRRRAARIHGDPLALAEKVERAIARLVPITDQPFDFSRPFNETPGPTEAEVEASAALKLAIDLDRSSRIMVKELVRFAAVTAENHDAEWVKLARSTESSASRFISRWLEMESQVSDDNHDDDGKRIVAQRAQTLIEALKPIAEL